MDNFHMCVTDNIPECNRLSKNGNGQYDVMYQVTD